MWVGGKSGGREEKCQLHNWPKYYHRHHLENNFRVASRHCSKVSNYYNGMKNRYQILALLASDDDKAIGHSVVTVTRSLNALWSDWKSSWRRRGRRSWRCAGHRKANNFEHKLNFTPQSDERRWWRLLFVKESTNTTEGLFLWPPNNIPELGLFGNSNCMWNCIYFYGFRAKVNQPFRVQENRDVRAGPLLLSWVSGSTIAWSTLK